jgi:cellulose synthase/poly-beta-1,6-N-acetylglucosamine synthase-like glycosyltransferase
VVFLEEHCRTSPGWLEAILQAFSDGPWVAVGPRVVSANPGAGFSDAMSMINYGDWAGGHHRAREVDMLPGNNSAYLREALLALDDALDTLLLSDTVLQWRLSEEGGRLFFEPQAVVAHRYPTTLWSAAKGEYLYHVGFGGARAESFGWPWPLRFGYALASPAVALLRLGRLLRGKGDPANVQQTRRNLLAVLALMSAAVLGQAAGVIFGPRAAQSRFTDYELNESRRALGEPPEGS